MRLENGSSRTYITGVKTAWRLVLAGFFLSALVNAQMAPATSELFVIVRNGLYGFIDHNGVIVIEPQFLWGAGFENGYGSVYVCGRHAFIDKSGKLSRTRGPQANPQLERKKVGDKLGFVDSTGNLRIAPVFDDALPFSDGLAAVKVKEHWGFIDSSGRFAVPPKFDEAFYFREGVGVVWSGNKTVLIDRSGNELARGYDVLSGVTSEERIPVSRSDKYGYLDLRGREVIPLAFGFAGTFSEGLAAVQRGAKWGYINKNGKEVIPFVFDYAGAFGGGLAPAKSGSKSGFINRSGSFAFQLDFDSASGFGIGDEVTDVSDFWTKTGRLGYVNTSGTVIWGPTTEQPDHPPLFGWSDEQKKLSCDVVSSEIRQQANTLPLGDE